MPPSRSPGREVRHHYNHLASLLDAQIRVGAWRDMDQTMERITPFIDEVGSTRTVTTLLGALDNSVSRGRPPRYARTLHNFGTF